MSKQCVHGQWQTAPIDVIEAGATMRCEASSERFLYGVEIMCTFTADGLPASRPLVLHATLPFAARAVVAFDAPALIYHVETEAIDNETHWEVRFVLQPAASRSKRDDSVEAHGPRAQSKGGRRASDQKHTDADQRVIRSYQWQEELVAAPCSCLVAINNRTQTRFVRVDHHCLSGTFVKEPPLTLLPSETYAFGSISTGMMSGTEGVVTYAMETRSDVRFSIVFDVPFLGDTQFSILKHPSNVELPFDVRRYVNRGNNAELIIDISAHLNGETAGADVFGQPLHDLYERWQRRALSPTLEALFLHVERVGTTRHTGLFRACGSHREVTQLRAAVECNKELSVARLLSYSVHSVAQTVKLFLIEMPYTLVPIEFLANLATLDGSREARDTFLDVLDEARGGALLRRTLRMLGAIANRDEIYHGEAEWGDDTHERATAELHGEARVWSSSAAPAPPGASASVQRFNENLTAAELASVFVRPLFMRDSSASTARTSDVEARGTDSLADFRLERRLATQLTRFIEDAQPAS